MKDIESIAQKAVSSEKRYCEGFFAGAKTGNYFFGINYALAVARKEFSYNGSSLLDETNVFDLAEIEQANIGQINMLTVSSFCGPKGIIWGMMFARQKKQKVL